MQPRCAAERQGPRYSQTHRGCKNFAALERNVRPVYSCRVRIRLKDVAALAGVSEATVSRVMNGKDGVSARTKADVVRVLAELGYEPAALRTSPRVGSIGLIVPELDNPVFPALAQAVEARLLGSGYVSILCCASRVGASEDDYVDTLLGRGGRRRGDRVRSPR